MLELLIMLHPDVMRLTNKAIGGVQLNCNSGVGMIVEYHFQLAVIRILASCLSCMHA